MISQVIEFHLVILLSGDILHEHNQYNRCNHDNFPLKPSICILKHKPNNQWDHSKNTLRHTDSNSFLQEELRNDIPTDSTHQIKKQKPPSSIEAF